MPKLTRTLVTVELADGTIYDNIRVLQSDKNRYQVTAQKHDWPSLVVKGETGKVPHLDYEPLFTAWAALKRLGLYAGDWEPFWDSDCVGYASETEEVDPTRPPAPTPLAAEDVSSSSSPTTPASQSNGSQRERVTRT